MWEDRRRIHVYFYKDCSSLLFGTAFLDEDPMVQSHFPRTLYDLSISQSTSEESKVLSSILLRTLQID